VSRFLEDGWGEGVNLFFPHCYGSVDPLRVSFPMGVGGVEIGVFVFVFGDFCLFDLGPFSL